MGRAPLVSIITPSFNQGQYVGQTIESVLHQEGNFYIDYVIVDGGSSDASVDVIRGFADLVRTGRWPVRCRGVSLRWLSERDGGQSEAVNKGLRLVRGEIIGWLNSDDRYRSGALQEVATRFARHPRAKAVFGGTIAVDANGNELWRHTPREVSLFNFFFRREGVPQPSVFFSRDFIRAGLYLNESLHYWLDHDLWVRALFRGFRFEKIDSFLSIQRYHAASKSCQGSRWFEAFGPEEERMRGKYLARLGVRRQLYAARLLLERMRAKPRETFKELLSEYPLALGLARKLKGLFAK